MSARRAARPLLAAGLLAALLVPAAPAGAAGGITSPGAGQVVTADAVVPLRAVVDGPATRPSELTLTEPGTGDTRIVAVSASPEGGELAADFDTACAHVGCAVRTPARNGAWTLRLRGAAADERTFELRIPPAVPSEVTAEPAADRVALQWRRGAEPDLTGYTVEDARGAPVSDVALDACDPAGRCRVELPADAGAWAVRAHRRTCPDCVTTLRSTASEPVRLQAAGPAGLGAVPEPPSEEPEPARADRQIPDQRSAFARAFGAGRPLSGQAPAAAPPAAGAAPAQEPDGSYDLGLGYTPPPAQGSGGASLEEALTALSSADRMRLLLLSGLLIGASLWLRRWARRAVAD